MIQNIINFIEICFLLLKIKWQAWISPIIVFIILSMMMLPLPSFMLDILFTFNITMSIVVLMVSLFIQNILEFSVFPTLLLFLTLLRLSLNIASTRIILLKGHIGSCAAGHVIESFGYFLVEGNFSVGIVIFMMLVIINFIVITKGAGRVAEVSARFMLDGMPGKQMSIDSDLNSGLINNQKAKIRRIRVVQEANFYGAMDGASKFVRGDAIAGILIMIINIIGGLIIGIFEHNMQFYTASKVYTLLTIGDGLVAQIPALIISIATGVIVTRVSTKKNISEQIIVQIFHYPQVFILSSLFLLIFGVIPGMPNFIFLIFSFILIIISYVIYYTKYVIFNESMVDQIDSKKDKKDKQDISWEQVCLEEVIKVEVGYLLSSLINIDNRNNLFMHIQVLRKEFVKHIGFLPPKIHIIQNNSLPKLSYRIFIRGVEYSVGRIFLCKFIAFGTKYVTEHSLLGNKIIDDTLKYPSFWIAPGLYFFAKKKYYDVRYPQFMIIMNLKNVMLSHAQDLFGRNELQGLCTHISLKMPKLIEELIPNMMNITCLHKILKNLLLENIPIRDMRTILETLIEYALTYKNIDELTSLVRISLRALITQHFFSNKKKIYVMAIDSKSENLLLRVMNSGENISESTHKVLLSSVRQAIIQQKLKYAPLIILVRSTIRFFISCLLRKYFPKLVILSDLEIVNDKKIVITSFIQCSK